MEIYGINFKKFCIVIATFISRICLITLANLAVIILPEFVENTIFDDTNM